MQGPRTFGSALRRRGRALALGGLGQALEGLLAGSLDPGETADLLVEELEGPLLALCGEDFYGALRDSHAAYMAMIERRGIREASSRVNLRSLQLELKRRLENYLIAALAMIRDEDPANVAMMRAALRPVDVLRAQLERERGRAAGGAASAGIEEAELAELQETEPAEQAAAEQEAEAAEQAELAAAEQL